MAGLMLCDRDFVGADATVALNTTQKSEPHPGPAVVQPRPQKRTAPGYFYTTGRMLESARNA